MPNVSKADALKLIRGQHEQIANLRNLSADEKAFKTWKQLTSLYVEKVFGGESKNIKAFEKIHFVPTVWTSNMNEDYWNPRCFKSGLDACEILLHRFIEELELFGDDTSTALPRTSVGTSNPASKKVFVVHGHDEKLKIQTARFLERLELEPVILHEQPDRGLTIIEKFEKHADVSFAIVLLTPDDEGRKKSTNPFPTLLHDDPEPQPRARQNVIFEFGYFLGRLGRSNVCGLYCEGVELPSDYSGVLYTKVDADGAWQFKLFKELKAAGFVIDANRLA